MKLVALIPARWASTRFPGKPLALIRGRPMIEHVYRRALAIPEVDEVHIATDSLEIQNAALAFNGRVVLTRPEHPSGSDRLAEAADILKLADEDIVLNIQGDQPAFDPDQPALLARALKEDHGLEMATLAIPLTNARDIHNPAHVKVAFGADQFALYFSRAPIPWPRDGEGEYHRHIGIYAYRAAFLRRFVALPEGRLERLERLEQLRALENGARIKVIVVSGLSPEVDVPADLAAAEEALRRESH
ncbi:MAG: 3-deoxy-manno-octulosonate cytidylyltransferase [Candidatus Adiutrix sp.]|jgi:3-deoxy-manno-octulosonate cytidylyltransferase (CMP-KDO synthetase)|nr:3-deoxy-manno-octulosonate cytidylyltransferase [Candidatus Adiutrix sp.]